MVSVRRSGRRRRHSLSREEIVEAAFRIASEGGDPSIRAVAARVGAAPMSLYPHVATKADLLDALAERVLAGIPEVPETGATGEGWREAVADRAVAHLAALRTNPWVVPILLARPNPGPVAVAVGEGYLRQLAVALPPDRAGVAFTALLALVYGTAGFLVAADSPDAQARSEVVARIRADDAPPRTEAASGALSQYGSESHFREAVAALLEGFSRRYPPI